MIGFTSCVESAPEDDNTVYKVEMGYVTKDVYDEAMNMVENFSSATYEKIATVKFYLAANTNPKYY